MALVIETGAGVANANSYVTVVEADAYFLARGVDAWADFEATEKETHLFNACASLETKYRGKWIGQKATSAQRLAWPRAVKMGTAQELTDLDGVPIPVNLVPEPVKTAQFEIAKVLFEGGNFDSQPLSQDAFVKRKKIDVLETEWDTGRMPTQTVYPYIDQILFGYATGAQGTVPTMVMAMGLTAQEANQGSDYDPYADPRYFIEG